MEVCHMGNRSQVLAVRERGGAVEVDLFYLNGAWIGREITVRPDELEPLGAMARPTFRNLAEAWV
jgi:hypothetical protein